LRTIGDAVQELSVQAQGFVVEETLDHGLGLGVGDPGRLAGEGIENQ